MTRHDKSLARLPAHPPAEERVAAPDRLDAYPEARMAAMAVRNIPAAPADDDVPDEWIRVLEGRA